MTTCVLARSGEPPQVVPWSKNAAGNDGTNHAYVVYDLTQDEPVSRYEEADSVSGAFACFDWRQTFTFVTSQNGHMALLTAVAR